MVCFHPRIRLVADRTKFDYIFHLDGMIEVHMSVLGYLEGGYWNPDQTKMALAFGKLPVGDLERQL